MRVKSKSEQYLSDVPGKMLAVAKVLKSSDAKKDAQAHYYFLRENGASHAVALAEVVNYLFEQIYYFGHIE